MAALVRVATELGVERRLDLPVLQVVHELLLLGLRQLVERLQQLDRRGGVVVVLQPAAVLGDRQLGRLRLRRGDGGALGGDTGEQQGTGGGGENAGAGGGGECTHGEHAFRMARLGFA
ncbi:hypothetical protein Sipo8835_45760 [Streptomyces ipomoeae]|uniref:Uncharacterized protein n=1 Tax=Streptomyces ipomoeae TaxID=103232 RepID=A0AAE8VV09_9ACTN|nr:hypothetical protein Sipo8835_45760 [Streptomyces ipomoeae]